MANLKKTLESGAVLEATLVFKVSLNLLKAVMKESEEIKVDTTDNVINVVKNFIAKAIYSDSIQLALNECFARATYNGRKITLEVFEDESAMNDYLTVVKEIMLYNLSPFLQSPELKSLRELLGNTNILK